MGDDGKLYVPQGKCEYVMLLITHGRAELVGIFRDEILPHASVILPNQFEAEQLTGTVNGMGRDDGAHQ